MELAIQCILTMGICVLGYIIVWYIWHENE